MNIKDKLLNIWKNIDWWELLITSTIILIIFLGGRYIRHKYIDKQEKNIWQEIVYADQFDYCFSTVYKKYEQQPYYIDLEKAGEYCKAFASCISDKIKTQEDILIMPHERRTNIKLYCIDQNTDLYKKIEKIDTGTKVEGGYVWF